MPSPLLSLFCFLSVLAALAEYQEFAGDIVEYHRKQRQAHLDVNQAINAPQTRGSHMQQILTNENAQFLNAKTEKAGTDKGHQFPEHHPGCPVVALEHKGLVGEEGKQYRSPKSHRIGSRRGPVPHPCVHPCKNGIVHHGGQKAEYDIKKNFPVFQFLKYFVQYGGSSFPQGCERGYYREFCRRNQAPYLPYFL